MNGIRYLLLPIMLLLSQSVFAAEAVFGTAAETEYTREITPPRGKAIVYIYQRAQDGSGVSPSIWLNNREIGRLVPGSFTVWQFAPGQVNVRVQADEPASHTIAVQAGKVYLFRLQVVQGPAGSTAQLTALPESYRGDLATTRLIKNPRELTVAAPAVRPTEPSAPAKAAAPAEQAVEDESAKKPVTRSRMDTVGHYGLMLKAGALTLAEEQQTILNRIQAFDDSASGVFGIEVNYRFTSDLSIGGEIIGYSADFVTVSNSDQGKVDITIAIANVRQYFRTHASVQPFIGAGIGAALTDFSGDYSGNTSGVAYQLLAGVEYRSDSFGLFGEYKYLSADTESGGNEKVDVSGSGIFGGIAFYF